MKRIPGRTLRIAGIVAAALLAVYAVAGFLVLPPLVKPRIIEEIHARTGRQASIGGLAVNPFALSATVDSFAVTGSDGSPIVSFARLYVNLEIISVFKQALVFDEITVTEPGVHLLIRRDGSVNLRELIPKEDPGREGEAAAQPPTVEIGRFGVERGSILYEDLNRTTPFTAKLDSFNLSLHDFTTRPDENGVYSLDAKTDRGEHLAWKGTVTFAPLKSAGSFSLSGITMARIWEFMRDRAWYRFTAGDLDVGADYAVDASREPATLTLANGRASIKDLRVRDTRDGLEAVVVPVVTVSGVSADAGSRRVRIGSIETERGAIATCLGSDTVFSIQTLFLHREDPKVVGGGSGDARSAPPWTIELGRLAVSSYAVTVTDSTITPPVTHRFAPSDLGVEGFVFGAPGTARVRAASVVNGAGSVSVNGTASGDPVAFDLAVRVEALDLRPFEPYARSVADVGILSGTVSADGRLVRTPAGLMTFRGGASSGGLRMVDRVLNNDFLRWSRVDVRKIAYASAPPSLSIDEIAARGLFARVVIGPDRVTNIQHLLRMPIDTSAIALPEYTGKAMPADTAAQVPAASPPPGPARTVRAVLADRRAGRISTRIRRVTIAGGTLNFSDLSMTPNFAVSIEELEGAVSGLSSEELAPADVDLQGRVDRYAPAVIRGQINPLSSAAFTDVTMTFTGIELTTFTPYAGRFAGYTIDKGKMNLDLRYRLNNTYLIGENRIVLDQLKLGSPVEGPDVTSLPVKLAVALLKDSRGVIDLDIPVEGDLEDPEFRIFPVILQVLWNLLVKIVTSPFALLGALFGGGEELSYVSFQPGSDSLYQHESTKLDSLAHALKERPELLVDVRGLSAPSSDRDAIARAAIFRDLRTDGWPGDTPPLGGERTRLLQLYRSTFNEDPGTLVAEVDSLGNRLEGGRRDDAIAQAAYNRLLAKRGVSEADYEALARGRAEAVKGHLVGRGGIDPARVFLLDPDTNGSADGLEVRVTLGLNAM